MPANRPSANMLLAHGDTPFGLDTWDIFDAPAHTDSAALDMESGVGFTGAGFVTDVGSGSALTPVLYLTEPGDNSAINVNDIHQGQIGDCFLLSAFGEMALYHPSAISNMIHFNPNGTETVFLYGGSNGSPPQFGQYSFTSMTETVTNTFSGSSVNNGATQDVVGSQKEIWPQVIEKAYALASGGYSGIQNGGSPFLALEELTGKAAIYYGVAEYFDDEKGHVLMPNQPLAVCDKTAGNLAALRRDDVFISNSTWFYDGGGCC